MRWTLLAGWGGAIIEGILLFGMVLMMMNIEVSPVGVLRAVVILGSAVVALAIVGISWLAWVRR